MSLSKGVKISATPFHDQDGSDGPPSHSKSQAQYAEEVKAHLEAARAALSQLTVASLGALCSDPTLDPVYVGCMRELAGLGCGHGGKEVAMVPRSIPMLVPASLERSVTSQRSFPGYTFIVHIFPRDIYKRGHSRADRPSNIALTRRITSIMKDNPSTAHIQSPTTVSWTTNGDLSISVPPDAIPLEELVQEIPILKTIDKLLYNAKWAHFRLRGAPTHFFLKLHRVPASWIPEDDFSRIRTFFQDIGSIGQDDYVQQMGNLRYTLPQDFHITGRTMVLGGGEEADSGLLCDAYIDISNLKHRIVESLRTACSDRVMLRARYQGNRCQFSTSFIELRDWSLETEV